ncbi:TetR family transcriptional regulator [Nocardia tengchongensis]|uniref:TetR family transcriptional regulator n=1 Tax=Nocardia tengchongensis TaxID=2055889 RepID=UPI003682FF4A
MQSTGGALIRDARRRAGLTQAELAARAGTVQPAIARWENGNSSVKLDDVLRLIRLCGLELELSLVAPGVRSAAKSAGPAVERALARHVHSGGSSTAERIVDAAVECLIDVGWEKTTVSEVAARAGLSRPTVYSYFGSREDLLFAVSSAAAQRISGQLMSVAEAGTNSGAEFVVESVVTVVMEYRRDPAASLLALIRPGEILAAQAVEVSRVALLPLLKWEPQVADELDEIAETVMRFVVSLMVDDGSRCRSEDGLRAYLYRRLIPSLHI